jgi:hypothetical protein
MRPLLWLAAAPLLLSVAACGADAATIGDEATSAPEIVRRPAGSDPAAPGSDPANPGAAGPGASTGNACIAQPACNGATGPQLGAARSWNHPIVSRVIVAAGPAYHRGRDQILSVGEAQWVIGKITYSLVDKDLKDEEVDVFLERGCGGSWEKLGTAITTQNGAHATVDGVEDTGGRVYFQIPKAKELGAGRHRIRLVVAGDQTSTDLRIDVLPKGSPIVVSDVDGTLTSSETAEYPALLTGKLPDAQPKAADALASLAAKGYHVVYLTARPEWLNGRTHEFLTANGFPAGTVHTTTGLTGALGGAAATFKTDELKRLAGHGHVIDWGFGNKASDTDAYDAAKVPAAHRIFLGVTDTHGGKRIDSYAEILPTLAAVPATCK